MLQDISPFILVHLATALVALPLGAWQLTARPGTKLHARTGAAYILIMYISLLSALFNYRPGTIWLFFYILAIVGLVTLTAGVVRLRQWLRTRTPVYLEKHAINMGFSWLGLFMAGMSQLFVNPRFGVAPMLGPIAYWSAFFALNALLYAGGSWWIMRRIVPRLARHWPAA